MRKLLIVFLMTILAVSSLSAVSKDGMEAYEVGRAFVSVLVSQDSDSTSEGFSASIDSLRPAWNEPFYLDYVDAMIRDGVLPAEDAVFYRETNHHRRIDVEGYSGSLYVAPMKDRRFSWFDIKAEDYKVMYSAWGEILEYELDGRITALIYADAAGTFHITIDAYDIEAGGRDIGDCSISVLFDSNSGNVSVTYDGRELPMEDIMALIPVIEAAYEIL